MIVKKFTAPTENEAILKAKEDLGLNAVVLNVKKMEHRGIAKLFKKDFVEVTAALEEKEFAQNVSDKRPVISEMQTPVSAMQGTSSAMQGGTSAAMQAVKEIASMDFSLNSSADKALEEKLDSIHDMIKNLRSDGERTSDRSVVSENGSAEHNGEQTRVPEKEEKQSRNVKFLKMIYNKLIESEVDEKLANEIVGDIESSLKKEANLDNIISAVYQKIILKLGEPKVIEIGERQNLVFFMGPTGVGKTTTIAKLASDFKLNKHKKIAMITADTYRMAAVEQLNTYAAILDIPVEVVYTPSDIVEAVKKLKDYELVLVDTAGRSHKNTEMVQELNEMVHNVETSDLDIVIDKFLVLSATTKHRDLINIANAFKGVDDYSILFTKLDETGAYGNILNVKCELGVPLSYTTYGQNVPDDIEVIDVQGLAKNLISGTHE